MSEGSATAHFISLTSAMSAIFSMPQIASKIFYDYLNFFIVTSELMCHFFSFLLQGHSGVFALDYRL